MTIQTLVVYYSRTGYTKRIAEAVASKLDSDIERIRDMKDRSGFIGYMRSGWEALRGKTPIIKDPESDPSDYDIFIIGTPVWVQRPSSPVLTYLHRFSDNFKKTAYFCTLSGSGAEKTMSKMEHRAKRPEATLSLTTNKVKDGDYQHEINRFISEIKDEI